METMEHDKVINEIKWLQSELEDSRATVRHQQVAIKATEKERIELKQLVEMLGLDILRYEKILDKLL